MKFCSHGGMLEGGGGGKLILGKILKKKFKKN
jgi:hypothetical protein